MQWPELATGPRVALQAEEDPVPWRLGSWGVVAHRRDLQGLRCPWWRRHSRGWAEPKLSSRSYVVSGESDVPSLPHQLSDQPEWVSLAPTLL